MHLPRRAAIGGIVLALAILLLPAAPASAHAQLVTSTPTVGARLPDAPDRASLRFSETVRLPAAAASWRLLDGTGRRLAALRPSVSGSTVEADLPALAAGGYVLSWRVVSTDAHPVAGAIPFAVGGAPLPVVRTPVEPPLTALDVVLAGLRAIGYAGLALAAGALAVPLLCWRRGLGSRQVARVYAVGSVTGAAATGISLLVYGPYVAATGWSGSFDPGLLQDTLATPYGGAGVVRAGLLLAALALGGTSRGVAMVRLAMVLAATLTYPPQGHAWSASGRWTPALLDAVHVAAMAVWLGGLAVLAVTLPRRGAVADGDEASDRPPAPEAPDLRRWSRLAASCVAALVATGTVQALREVGGWSTLTGTRYGVLLLVKLGVVALVLLVAATAWRRVRSPDGAAGLRGRVLAEAGGAAVVLAVTGLLVATVPAVTAGAGTAPARAVASLPGGGSARMTVGSDRLLRVAVLDAAGKPAQTSEVTAVAALPSGGITGLALQGFRQEGGEWVGGGPPLPLPGEWRITVLVRRPDSAVGVGSATLEVR